MDYSDDPAARATGLPPLDSFDQWPYLSGAAAESPRNEILISDTAALWFNCDGQALVGGIIRGDYKLLVRPKDKDYAVGQDVRTGPFWPNSTEHMVPIIHPKKCAREPETGCMYDIRKDPYEEHNLAAAQPGVFQDLLAAVDAAQATVYSPKRGGEDPAACRQARESNWGFWGPWLDAPAPLAAAGSGREAEVAQSALRYQPLSGVVG